MLRVDVILERHGTGPPVTLERTFIANAGSAGGSASNYKVWAKDPRPEPGAPDAWVFGHERDDGASVLAAKAIEALQKRGCVGECRL